MKRPYVIGVTGGVATGKSTVARMFERLGALRIDCDRLAHEALRKGTESYEAIRRLFGKSILLAGGSISRRRLSREVFSSPARRRMLEDIVHPYVFSRIDEIVARSKASAVALEVPLLFETGYSRSVDCVVVVACSLPEAIRRARRNLGITEEEAKARIHSQLPMSVKIRKADFVIRSEGAKQETFLEVKQVWRQLIKKMR